MVLMRFLGHFLISDNPSSSNSSSIGTNVQIVCNSVIKSRTQGKEDQDEVIIIKLYYTFF